jgi:hypothetical protein
MVEQQSCLPATIQEERTFVAISSSEPQMVLGWCTSLRLLDKIKNGLGDSYAAGSWERCDRV